MMEQPLVVIESEKERAHDFALAHRPLAIPKTTNDAVSAAMALDLLHAGAISGLIRQGDTLGNDTVAASTCGLQPLPGVFQLHARRRKAEQRTRKAACGQLLQLLAPFRQMRIRKIHLAAFQEIERQEQSRRLT